MHEAEGILNNKLHEYHAELKNAEGSLKEAEVNLAICQEAVARLTEEVRRMRILRNEVADGMTLVRDSVADGRLKMFT